MSINYDIALLRNAVDTGLRDLSENERRVCGEVLDRLVARVKELALAKDSGDIEGQETAIKRIDEIKLGLSNSIRLIQGRERMKAADAWAGVFDEAKHFLDEATRYAMGVAVEALAGAALKAFAG